MDLHRMQRTDPDTGEILYADVHQDEMEEYRKGGWEDSADDASPEEESGGEVAGRSHHKGRKSKSK